MTFVAPESSGWAIVAPLAQVIFHYLNINRFSLPEPPDIQVTGTVSCDHVELAPDLPMNFTLLSNILSTVCSQSRNLKAHPPPPFLVFGVLLQAEVGHGWEGWEGGWCEGRTAAVMSLPDHDKGTGVATHRLTHQTNCFSLHDWIILILVWQKVNDCDSSSAIHANV